MDAFEGSYRVLAGPAVSLKSAVSPFFRPRASWIHAYESKKQSPLYTAFPFDSIDSDSIDSDSIDV